MKGSWNTVNQSVLCITLSSLLTAVMNCSNDLRVIKRHVRVSQHFFCRVPKIFKQLFYFYFFREKKIIISRNIKNMRNNSLEFPCYKMYPGGLRGRNDRKVETNFIFAMKSYYYHGNTSPGMGKSFLENS